MKRSKKPLTVAAIVASIGALSIAVEGCVYGPPPENHDGTKATTKTQVTAEATKPEAEVTYDPEVCVYGPAPDTTEEIDQPEEDVYGPPADATEG